MRRDFRQRLIHARRARHLAVFEFHHRLDDRHHARQSERVTDLADRGRQHRGHGPIIRRQDFTEHLGFLTINLRVADGRHFDHADGLRGGHAAIEGAFGGLLVRFVVVVNVERDPHAADHPVDFVAIALGIGQPLEQHHGGPFTGHHPVHPL